MILNTRPLRYEAAFRAAFAGFGHDIVSCPMLNVERVDSPYPTPSAFDAVIFTSQIAVDIFPADVAWQDKQVFTVGEATAATARNAGFKHIVCAGQNARDLEAVLKGTDVTHALYPSAETVAADLSQAFPGRVTRVAVYRTVPAATMNEHILTRLASGERTYAPLLSRRTAEAFAAALRHAGIDQNNADIAVIGISEAIHGIHNRPWRNTVIAPHATLSSVAETLRAALNPVAEAA